MKIHQNECLLNFLNTFFVLFKANIKNIKIEKEKVIGTLSWENEEETQDFLWNNPDENFNYTDITDLIKYLIKNKLISIDKIIISKDSLINKLKDSGWNPKKINNSLNALFSVKIHMIDEGEITDYFFIHF